MISNEQVEERVMRMGIEHRGGVPLDRLHALARKQLAEEAKRIRPVMSAYSSFEEWLADPNRFAFMYLPFGNKNKPRLHVVNVKWLTTPLRLIEWRTPSIPLVERIHA